jgi:hypothetical protein
VGYALAGPMAALIGVRTALFGAAAVIALEVIRLARWLLSEELAQLLGGDACVAQYPCEGATFDLPV